jgi:hypothetical protein
MPPLDAGSATTTTANVNVELTDEGAAWDLGLKLGGDLGLVDLCTAMRASVGKGSIENFIDLFGRGRRAVAVATVGDAGLASGRFWL